MFAKERDYSAFLQTVRIDVGTLVGLEKDEDAYIVLKELPTLEMLRLKEAADKGERATLEVIRELLPSMITDHSFFEDTKGQRKMKAEDVAELVFSSLELTLELTAKVVDEYTTRAFRSRRRTQDGKSRVSPAQSSADSATK